MNVSFIIYAFFVLFIFNSLTHSFCTKSEMEAAKQVKIFRVTNIMIVILLVNAYVRILNVMA